MTDYGPDQTAAPAASGMRIRNRAGRLSALPMNRGQYMLGGAILMLLGLVLFAATVWIALSVVAGAELAGQRNQAGITACSQALSDLGFQVQVEGRSIIARQSGLDGAALKLGRASAASLLCPGWQLTRFCMGEACEIPNSVFLEIRPS